MPASRERDVAAIRQREERLDDLGEVPREWAVVTASQVDPVSLAERERAEAVPLRLVQVAVARQLALEAREHRSQRRADGERY